MLRELSLGTLERVTGGSAGRIRGRDRQRLLATIALRLPQLRWHAHVLKFLQLQVCATAALARSRLHVRLEHTPHLQGGKVGSDRIKGGAVRRGAVRCGAARCGAVRRGAVLDCRAHLTVVDVPAEQREATHAQAEQRGQAASEHVD